MGVGLRDGKYLLLLLVLLCCLPAGVRADEDDEEFLDEFYLLEEAATVELAARHRQDIGMSPSAITVITREEIETSGAINIPDLLRQVPGLEVIRSNLSTSALSARLHWNDENHHFLVLVDGQEVNIELLGQAPWEILPFTIEDIERIEVIRGPASALYGANAFAGVVSVTTRAVPEETSSWAGVEGGEAGVARMGARASTRLGAWGFSVSGGAELYRAGHQRDASAVQMVRARTLVERRWSDTERLLLEAGICDGFGPRYSTMGDIDFDFVLATVRSAYQSDEIRARLYWTLFSADQALQTPLDFGGVRLAKTVPVVTDTHTLDGEMQWTLPRFWNPMLVIVGATGRAAYLGSDQFLDADTFADPTSRHFHQAGVSHWEYRLGGFLHAELAPTDWVTVTAGARLDYNSETAWFASPRLAAVFRPVPDQFVRVGVARAFRKPAYLEKRTHINVAFPENSPLTGSGRDDFREFMLRLIGNSDLDNEEIVAFEIGYLGRFLDGKLSVSLDLYANLYSNRIQVASAIVSGQQGLPDLDRSSFRYENTADEAVIAGGELLVRYQPTTWLSLLASWTHRERFDRESGRVTDEDPKNFITAGGSFRTRSGFVGSLYAHTRSEYVDRSVPDPRGLLAPFGEQRMESVVVLLGRLGYGWTPLAGTRLEAGLKLFLPVSPFAAPYSRFREKGGGVSAAGVHYGAVELERLLTLYLQGSF